MEIDLNRHIYFVDNRVLLRGRILRDGIRKCAIISLPSYIGKRELTNEELKDIVRPLLVAEFSAGRWYDMGENTCFEMDKSPVREPITVEV